MSTTTPHSAPRHHPSLVLNDGAKWRLDSHTRSAIAKIEAAVDEKPVSNIDEANALAEVLDEQTKRLIAGCTMTGPAHDQLHVFLSQWMPAIQRLRTTRGEETTAARADIVELLATFAKHFE